MGHSFCRLLLIAVMCVVYIATVVISYLGNTEFGLDSGLYKNSTREISDRFDLTITPASWTFSIWGIIYTWQFIWIIFVLSTICRRVNGDSDKHVYQLPVTPDLFYIFFIINNCLTLAWIFLWDRQLVGWSLLDIVFTPLTCIACLVISFVRLYQNLEFLRSSNHTVDIWLTRFLIQNGIAFLTTWLTIATILNFAIVLHYKWGIEEGTASLIGLIILSVEIVLWFSLENFVVDKYVRYTFSPYVVFVFGLAGNVAKNYNIENNYTISVFLVVLLAVSSFLFLVKVVMMFWRHIRSPIKGNVQDDLKGTLA